MHSHRTINTRRLLTLLAAVAATAAPLLIFAADTAGTPEAAPTVANVLRLVGAA